jgi:hypothetical protein
MTTPSCRILRVEHGETVRIELVVSPPPADGRIKFLAAMPAERRTSFTGSGMPLANQRAALEGTTNRGTARPVEGTNDVFEVVLPRGFPGVYHSDFGASIAPPTLHVLFRLSDADNADNARAWLRVPIADKHPTIHHRSSLNYLPKSRDKDNSPAAQDTLLFRTRY